MGSAREKLHARFNLVLGTSVLLILMHGFYGLFVPSLHRAAQRSSLRHVEREIRWGADVDRVAFGYTPLSVAALHGRAEIATALLQAGAKPDGFMDRERDTPLFSAIRYNHVEICQLLLEAGADPNSGNQPPLEWAINTRGRDCVPSLLDHGADAQTESDQGVPMIFHAVRAVDEPVVKALLDHGASLSQKTREGLSLEAWLEESEERAALEFLRNLRATWSKGG